MGNNISENGQANSITCPFCATLNNANAKFCRKCGKNIAAFSNTADQEQTGGNTGQETVNRCPVCGVINSPEAGFCKECGKKLVVIQEPAQRDTTQVEKPLRQEPVVPVQPEPMPVEKEPEPTDVEEAVVQETVNRCPVCGAINSPEAGFCKECGNRLSAEHTEAQATQIRGVPLQAGDQNNNDEKGLRTGNEALTQATDQPVANEEKNHGFSLKKLLIPLLCLILLLAGAGGFYLYKNGKLPNPGGGNPVNNYVEALNKKNYAAAYQLLNVKESAFVNAAQFEKFVKWQAGKGDPVYSKLGGNLEKLSTGKKRETENTIVYEVKANADGQPFSFMMEVDKQTNKIKLADTDYAPVELEAPPGTEIKIDGIKVENGFKLDGLFAGKYAVEAQNPFLEIGYNNNFLFEPEKQSKVKVVHTAWLKANQIGVVDNASLSFINDFLKATIKNEGLKHETLKYKDDDSLNNMYQKINSYMLKNGITEMIMTEGKTTNPVYAADGKIHSQYDFSGTYKKGQDGRVMNANGSIQLQFVIEGNDVIVSKVDSYNLHVKK